MVEYIAINSLNCFGIRRVFERARSHRFKMPREENETTRNNIRKKGKCERKTYPTDQSGRKRRLELGGKGESRELEGSLTAS